MAVCRFLQILVAVALFAGPALSQFCEETCPEGTMCVGSPIGSCVVCGTCETLGFICDGYDTCGRQISCGAPCPGGDTCCNGQCFAGPVSHCSSTTRSGTRHFCTTCEELDLLVPGTVECGLADDLLAENIDAECESMNCGTCPSGETCISNDCVASGSTTSSSTTGAPAPPASTTTGSPAPPPASTTSSTTSTGNAASTTSTGGGATTAGAVTTAGTTATTSGDIHISGDISAADGLKAPSFWIVSTLALAALARLGLPRGL